jgi:hypothetical protein
MGFLEMLKLMLSLLPAVMDAVKAVEVAIPQAGAGAKKLETVLSTVQAVIVAAPPIVSSTADIRVAVKASDVPNIMQGLTHMVSAVVGLFNATGAFQKSGFVQAVTAADAAEQPGTPVALQEFRDEAAY